MEVIRLVKDLGKTQCLPGFLLNYNNFQANFSPIHHRADKFSPIKAFSKNEGSEKRRNRTKQSMIHLGSFSKK